jgi:competence protein ComFC
MEALILRFKFGDRPQLAGPLAGMLAEVWRSQTIFVDLISSIPLGIRRRRARGYDQAQLLAKRLAQELVLPYQETLVRRRETKAQSRLSREERLRNVQGCFSLHSSSVAVQGKEILLVDDVLTTGATMTEASRVLLAAGAMAVFSLTLARGSGSYRTSSKSLQEGQTLSGLKFRLASKRQR